MTEKSTPKNKSPVKRKILAVVGIAIALCSTFTIVSNAFSVGGKYPEYVASAIAPLEINGISSSPSAMQTWQGRIDYYSGSNDIPLGWDETYEFNITATGGYRQFDNGSESIRLSWGKNMNFTQAQIVALNEAYVAQSTPNDDAFQAFRYGYGVGQIYQQYTTGYISHDYSGFAYPTLFADYGGIYYSIHRTDVWANPRIFVNALLSYKAIDGSVKDITYRDWMTATAIHDVTENQHIYDFNVTKFLVDLVRSQSDNMDDTPTYILCHDLKVGNDTGGYATTLTRLCNIGDNFKQSDSLNHDNFGANVYDALITSDEYRVPNVIVADPPTLDGLGSFLSTAVTGFFSVAIFPGITLGGIFTTLLMVALVIAFLKIFAGG